MTLHTLIGRLLTLTLLAILAVGAWLWADGGDS